MGSEPLSEKIARKQKTLKKQPASASVPRRVGSSPNPYGFRTFNATRELILSFRKVAPGVRFKFTFKFHARAFFQKKTSLVP